ncbi:MAG: PAS domain-containing protein [Spirochaetota bacterium]
MLDADELRKKAEGLAGLKPTSPPDTLEGLSPEGSRKILHDLRVHQIELELQNEELRDTQVELDSSLHRYFDLYDLAPVGYFTLSEKGLILEANLTAAALFGLVRSSLVGRSLSRFIVAEDQTIYYAHHRLLLETGLTQSCELRVVTGDGRQLWTKLTSSLADGEGGGTSSQDGPCRHWRQETGRKGAPRRGAPREGDHGCARRPYGPARRFGQNPRDQPRLAGLRGGQFA